MADVLLFWTAFSFFGLRSPFQAANGSVRGITAMGKKGKRKDDKNEEAEPSGERSSSRKQDPFYANGLWVECHYNADAEEHKFKCSITKHDADTGMYGVKAKDDNEVWTVHWDPNHGPGHGIWVKEMPVTPEAPNKAQETFEGTPDTPQGLASAKK